MIFHTLSIHHESLVNYTLYINHSPLPLLSPERSLRAGVSLPGLPEDLPDALARHLPGAALLLRARQRQQRRQCDLAGEGVVRGMGMGVNDKSVLVKVFGFLRGGFQLFQSLIKWKNKDGLANM